MAAARRLAAASAVQEVSENGTGGHVTTAPIHGNAAARLAARATTTAPSSAPSSARAEAGIRGAVPASAPVSWVAFSIVACGTPEPEREEGHGDWALGVPIGSSRVEIAIWLAILFLLYAQYFGIFTAFVGTTPGMRHAGLRVVSFDGNPPTPRQLLWRTFGYLVAGGAGMLGFLWALWDDDKLCWQDRTSQTYLTALVPVPEQHTAEARR